MQFQFDGFADFLAMNGHGVYVWVAYAITFAAMSALVVQPLLRRRQLQNEVERQQRIQARRQNRAQVKAEPLATTE